MKTVLISAGHSETDPGAVSGIYKESTLALLMRDRVFHMLKAKGVNVLRDGDDGENESLNRAIALCRKADIAVEIHFNAGSATAHGIEALAKPDKKKIAQDLCKALAVATGIRLRGDYGYKPDNSGQHHRLGFCEAGGIILEVCFITSRDDMAAYVPRKLMAAQVVADVLYRYAAVKAEIDNTALILARHGEH
jgi:N-acetylmuramoyl-L-alanine amidase